MYSLYFLDLFMCFSTIYFSGIFLIILFRMSLEVMLVCNGRQVFEEVVASSVAQQRILNPMEPGSWGRSIKDLGHLAYLIRATHLSNFSVKPLPIDVLAAVDTYKMTALHVRILPTF